MAGAIGYSLYALSKVRDETAIKTEETRTKSRAVDELIRQVEAARAEVEHIRSGPLSDLIVPKAIAVRREGLKDQDGRQLYNFIVWLDLPYARKAEIREVQYVFGDRSFLRNRHMSVEPSNGFAVGYLGWGAMRQVPITVVPSRGEAFSLDFPMFDAMTIVDEPGA